MEHGLRSVVKIRAQLVLVSAWLVIGEGEEELRKKRERVRLIEERDGDTVPDRDMAVVDQVHAEVEEVFDWSTVRWSEKMRAKLTVG